MGQRADELGSREPAVVGRDNDEDQELAETTAAARQEIELTRADMTSTIDAIQDKLDPEVLSEQAKDTAHDVTDYAIREAREAAREITEHAITQAREAVLDITGQAKVALREATIGKVENMARTATDTAGGWRQSVVDTVKANPLPAAIVGLGIGWMFLNRPSGARRSQAYNPRYGSTYVPPAYGSGAYRGSAYGTGTYEATAYGSAPSEQGGMRRVAEGAQQNLGRAAEGAQETVGQVAEQVQGTAGQVIEQVQNTGEQVVDQVQQQAARAQGFLERQLEENPLLVGAVAVAIGGVLAATVPSTRREDELLGETRDRVVGKARGLTDETMHKVGRVIDQAQTAAKEEAREQSLVPDGGASTGAS
jgi:hypothetical protein